MPSSPKDIEDKIQMVLNAWQTLAPDSTFGEKTLAQFKVQVAKSIAARQRLVEIEDEKKQELVNRDAEDDLTLRDVQFIVSGVLADPKFGDDSALYEAMGYIRKSMRKSGLTRKKKTPLLKRVAA